MEGASETSANVYQFTWNHIPKDSNLHNRHCEHRKFRVCILSHDTWYCYWVCECLFDYEPPPTKIASFSNEYPCHNPGI